MLTSDNSHLSARGEQRKRPVQARSKQTVEVILEAAAQVLTAAGYAGTTTNHVAERAGVSIGSLYQYFPNKDALLVALEDRHLDEVDGVLSAAYERWRRELPEPSRFAAQLTGALIAANDSELHRVIYNNAPPLARTQERIRTLIAELTGEVGFHMRRWGTPGEHGLRAAILVIAVLAAIHELVIQEPAGPERARTERELENLVLGYVSPPG